MSTQIKSPERSVTQSGLLGLPIELKQQIFRPLLIVNRTINLEFFKAKDFPKWWMHVDGNGPGIDPGIMDVCSVLRYAAATVLYQENSFIIWSPAEAHRFAMLENAEQVRSFTFMINDPTVRKWCSYFEGEHPAFSFKNDFHQVKDLCLLFMRTSSAAFPWSERSIHWEFKKLEICNALVRNIKVLRDFRIRDLDIPRSAPHKLSKLEKLVKGAMDGKKQIFDEYHWEINYAIQQGIRGDNYKDHEWQIDFDIGKDK